MDKQSSYLSLKTVAQQYGYTRDHLGLMIRQGRLKGVKLGSYYVTTAEWMLDYIKNFADPNHPAIKNKLSNKFLADVLAKKKPKDDTGGAKDIVSRVKNSAYPKLKKTSDNLAIHKSDKFQEPQTELQKELLKEFTNHVAKIDLSCDNAVSISSELPNNEFSQPLKHPNIVLDEPYVILPIRKMQDLEHDRILKKIEGDSIVESAE